MHHKMILVLIACYFINVFRLPAHEIKYGIEAAIRLWGLLYGTPYRYIDVDVVAASIL